jgi:hypothetical protein
MQTRRGEIDQADPGGANRPALAAEPADDTDYEHRHFINLLAIIFLLAIGGAIISFAFQYAYKDWRVEGGLTSLRERALWVGNFVLYVHRECA